MSNGAIQDRKLGLELGNCFIIAFQIDTSRYYYCIYNSILLFSQFFEGNISKESLDSLGKDVERIIIRGPRQYIEQPNEWMHEFKWHGSSEKSDYDSGKTKKVFSSIQIH